MTAFGTPENTLDSVHKFTDHSLTQDAEYLSNSIFSDTNGFVDHKKLLNEVLHLKNGRILTELHLKLICQSSRQPYWQSYWQPS